MKIFTRLGILLTAGLLGACGGGGGMTAPSGSSGSGSTVTAPPVVVADITCLLDTSTWDDSIWAD